MRSIYPKHVTSNRVHLSAWVQRSRASLLIVPPSIATIVSRTVDWLLKERKKNRRDLARTIPRCILRDRREKRSRDRSDATDREVNNKGTDSWPVINAVSNQDQTRLVPEVDGFAKLTKAVPRRRSCKRWCSFTRFFTPLCLPERSARYTRVLRTFTRFAAIHGARKWRIFDDQPGGSTTNPLEEER